MARSRSPLHRPAIPASRGEPAPGGATSQFPTRTPFDFTLFTRLMLAATWGGRSPLSVASPASLRIADMRMMIEEEPRPRVSSDARQALTVALLKPGRGSLPEPIREFIQRHVLLHRKIVLLYVSTSPTVSHAPENDRQSEDGSRTMVITLIYGVGDQTEFVFRFRPAKLASRPEVKEVSTPTPPPTRTASVSPPARPR
jgi:hypothetical protein